VSTSDTLHRFLFEHAAIRGEHVHLDASWRAVLERHPYPPAVRNLLGELMAAAALLSATLKFTGSIILQIQGEGPVRLLVVEATSERTLRGMAQWDELPESHAPADLIGSGRFVITIDPRESGQRYQGIVAIEGESVAAVLENYLQRSEQLESRLRLAADGEHAAGLLLQRLPGKHDEDEDAWNHVTRLGATLTNLELLSLSGRDVLHRLFHEEDLRLFDPEPVRFSCTCSRERVVAMLRMLGYSEVQSILREQGNVDVHCEFCNKQYKYDSVDAEQLFAAESGAPASSTRH
jgi:molecular chaperone Hsp33